MLNELNLAIVGHTNVGKTSLLRTLIQDSDLGVVSDKPGYYSSCFLVEKVVLAI